MKLFKSCFLTTFNLDNNKAINFSIDMIYPEGITFSDEKKEKIFKCSNSFIDANEKNKVVFAFNVDKTFYFALIYIEKSKTSEIVIESEGPFAYMYSEFFKEANKMFIDNNFNDPNLRFAYITSLLETWDNDFDSKIEVNFPTGLTEVTLGMDHFSYEQYNPTLYFSKEAILEAYNALIYKQPIVVYAKDANDGTNGALGLFSLLSPLQYSEPFSLWMTEDDERIKNIEESGLLFVVTNVKSLVTNPYFKLALKSKPTGLILPRSEYNSCFSRTRYLSNVFIAEIDTQLLNDPWADTLNERVDIERMKEISSQAYGIPLDAKAKNVFYDSETWKIWRQRMKWRDEWVEAMKGCDPVECIEKHKSHNEIELIRETISKIPERLKKDKHFMAVIKHYKKLIDSISKEQTN